LGFLLKISFITGPLSAETPSSGGLLDKWIYQSAWLKLNPVFMAFIAIIIILFTALYLNFILTQKEPGNGCDFLHYARGVDINSLSKTPAS
jgi:hypothetical protein